MYPRRPVTAPALFALAAGLVATCGCDSPKLPLVPGNQPPTVRITSAPIDTTLRNYYLITINWIANDPDGRVDRFLYAIDPPAESDTLWQETRENALTKSFPSTSPDHQSPINASDFHVFVIKAVDNRGRESVPVVRAFWSYTQAPRVQVIQPRANSLVRYAVPPSLIIRWEGFDDDGVFTQKPVKYKYKLLTESSEVPLSVARSRPDEVRKYYAPRFWAGWDSLPGDTTQKQFTNLTVSQGNVISEYVFVVVAFDEAGAYSPIFSRNTNTIHFRVTFSGAQNPRIGLFNEFFLYEYELGKHWPLGPDHIVRLEVPADDKVKFDWYAKPSMDSQGSQIGGDIRSYRWAVDIVDVFDETERSDEENDLSRWSQKSNLVTSCRIGPFAGGESHLFYLEAEDINGLKSLGMIEFKAVQATLAKPLLIVDDTRLLIDEISVPPCPDRPVSFWPTASELDTFLFARGGVPWRCYPPVGGQPQLSPPGIFNGYEFDAVGTNLGVQDLTFKLSTLGRYQNVIWLVDGKAPNNNDSGSDLTSAKTSMRYMNANRRVNTLATYVRQGGRVWLAGGGAATASLMEFNLTSNDLQLPDPRATTFRSNEELVPGRFVHDQGHWRSEFKIYPVANGVIRRHLGRWEGNPGVYQGLPPAISRKTPATDPFPPNRAVIPSLFYQTIFDMEFLSAPNEILEGEGDDLESTLDTLYTVTANSLPPTTGPEAQHSVVMTRYTGRQNAEFIMTGFSLWSFRRSHCVELVDFVLQRLWGLTRSAPAPVNAGPARRQANRERGG